MVTVPLGRVGFRVWQPEPALLESQNAGSKQGSPVTLARADELGRLVDGALMAVVKCLPAWARIGPHRPLL